MLTTTTTNKKLKVTYLTNIPAPYRERMHELLAACINIGYNVIYCSEHEPNRKWEFEKGNYEKIYLSKKKDKMIHNNLNVVKHLSSYNPDVVISSGFNPTMLYGFVWCVVKGKKFIPFTDGTFKSEQQLSSIHRFVRRIVFKYSFTFIGASKGSVKLYESYHIPARKIFKSCLCVDNSSFNNHVKYKKYDLMFSGQLIDRKMPLFFAAVAGLVKNKMGQCHVLILGDGELKDELLKALLKNGVTFDYQGFVQSGQLPGYYCLAKLFLFPTLNDPWGIVVNEACASGLPVITCSNAGVAEDLIIDGYNGFILPLETEVWAKCICNLLTYTSKLNYLSNNAIKQVKNYNYQTSVNGIFKAVNYVTGVKALPVSKALLVK